MPGGAPAGYAEYNVGKRANAWGGCCCEEAAEVVVVVLVVAEDAMATVEVATMCNDAGEGLVVESGQLGESLLLFLEDFCVKEASEGGRF